MAGTNRNQRYFTIRRGMTLPLGGAPDQKIEAGPEVKQVGLLGDDYVGMKPTMLVGEGDEVKLGQPVFEDKKTAGVQFTAPAAGKVVSVNRGAKRKFESLVIEVADGASESFTSYKDTNLGQLDRDKSIQNLLASGLWTALRTRPYSKVPAPESTPKSIFVTAIDTNPHAINPEVVINYGENEGYFSQGLQVLTTLTDGKVFLCTSPDADIPGATLADVDRAIFEGPHPAGLVGTHIHFLDPVDGSKVVWHIGYQDVIAIGRLFTDGVLSSERFVSVAGDAIGEARIVRTQLGASISDLTANFQPADDVRTISGSVLSGRISREPVGYLGRYHNQVSVISNGGKREFLGWAMPGGSKFSTSRAFLSSFFPAKAASTFTTSTNGSKRAIVPIGSYEGVMPLDIIATPLLKALCVQDTDTAQTLGCLELDEEDLALCTFVCPGKNEYGPMLRQALDRIEKEG